jgi:hypothetical protein
VGAHEGSIHIGGSSQKSGGLSVSHGPGGDGGHPSASGLSKQLRTQSGGVPIVPGGHSSSSLVYGLSSTPDTVRLLSLFGEKEK